ncbi:MAG: carboxypeptidase-like regulatory domain-containing protein [Haliscomenobacter sp.]|nr:carboxypeptidase-like regulatory domain-containing protein [Haliscomenobacter sp.]MBK9492266.1 carboxypeptidase-like regulatory domain-containing protein [Haliscomenobacter sp.]
MFFLLSCTAGIVAQSMTVKGTVTDEKGVTLIGVSILVEGTSTGTTTDLDGTYELKADKGASLQFSYTGFTMQTIVVGDNAKIDVSCSPMSRYWMRLW